VAVTDVFLIAGIPGSGKTTVARLLSRRFPRGAHIEADEIQNLITSGGLHPQEEPAGEALRQYRLRTTNVALLADSFARASIVPVIDDTVVERSRVAAYLSDLQARPLRLVLLAPPKEVALDRDRMRGYKQVGHIWGYLDEVMRNEMEGLGVWLDNSTLTPEETVDEILSHADDAVVERA
jgi:adenylate kinase family enzyme